MRRFMKSIKRSANAFFISSIVFVPLSSSCNNRWDWSDSKVMSNCQIEFNFILFSNFPTGYCLPTGFNGAILPRISFIFLRYQRSIRWHITWGGGTGTESRNAYEQKKNCVRAQNGNRNETPLPHLSINRRRRKKHIWKANNRWFFNTIESVFSYRFIIHIWHLLNEAYLLLFAFNISKLFTYQLTDWNTFVHVQNCHNAPLKWKFHFINLSLCQMI